MSVLYRVALLVLLVLQGSNAEPEECNDMPKRLQASAVDQILGKWVLVGAVADFDDGTELLKTLSSSRINLEKKPDNTVRFSEDNILNDTCVSFYTNLTVKDTDPLSLHAEFFYKEEKGVVSLFNYSGEADIYEGSPDCLIVMWDIVHEGKPVHYLLSYKRDGKHQGDDVLKAAEEHHRERATCLKFPAEGHFIYDGVAEFCSQKTAEEPTNDQPTSPDAAAGENVDATTD